MKGVRSKFVELTARATMALFRGCMKNGIKSFTDPLIAMGLPLTLAVSFFISNSFSVKVPFNWILSRRIFFGL